MHDKLSREELERVLTIALAGRKDGDRLRDILLSPETAAEAAEAIDKIRPAARKFRELVIAYAQNRDALVFELLRLRWATFWGDPLIVVDLADCAKVLNRDPAELRNLYDSAMSEIWPEFVQSDEYKAW